VPNPQTYLYNPIGKVNSGLLTVSRYQIANAERVALPCPFSWPLRIVNLKRCLLVSRYPVKGADHELVLVNLHLEAYDSGEGKAAQTALLKERIEAEYAAGNYVIAGGDFNQIFSDCDDGTFAVREGMWAPGRIETTDFGDGWQCLMDSRVPSCRSLDAVYEGADKENWQYYLIDGFIVSDNLSVESIETKDLGFVCSDHNPVVMKVRID
jgi:endonuclease/exonuclease/phosphatase family metal-dependent hydrolase